MVGFVAFTFFMVQGVALASAIKSQWKGEMSLKGTNWALQISLPLTSDWLELGHMPHIAAREPGKCNL